MVLPLALTSEPGANPLPTLSTVLIAESGNVIALDWLIRFRNRSVMDLSDTARRWAPCTKYESLFPVLVTTAGAASVPFTVGILFTTASGSTLIWLVQFAGSTTGSLPFSVSTKF